MTWVLQKESGYKRVGLSYKATNEYLAKDGEQSYRITQTFRLSFVSYWLIKWIHGDKKLKEMAE